MQSSGGSGPAPGWYPDPQGQGQRYWDGTKWTEQVRAAAGGSGGATQIAPAIRPGGAGPGAPAPPQGGFGAPGAPRPPQGGPGAPQYGAGAPQRPGGFPPAGGGGHYGGGPGFGPSAPGGPGGYPPQKKRNTGAWIAGGVLALLVVLGIVLALVLSGGDDESENVVSAPTPRPSVSPSPTGTATPDATGTPDATPQGDSGEPVETEAETSGRETAKVGTKATDDGVTFDVRSIQYVENVPRDEFTEGGDLKASPSKLFVRADVSYVNETGAPLEEVFCGGQSTKVRSNSGKTFGTIRSLVGIIGNEDYCASEPLQDGEEADVVLVFRVPRREDIQGIILYNGRNDADPFGEQSSILFTP